MLFAQPDSFREPHLPLLELCTAAGLEARGNAVAGEPEAWVRREVLRAAARVHSRLDDSDDQRSATRALVVFFDPDASTSELRAALGELRRLEPLTAVVDEVIGDETSYELALAEDLAERLLQVARHPAHIAVARWIAAVVAERNGNVVAADAHVQAAADPHWEPAVDRAAWYASDKGDAATAAELWGRIGQPTPELDALQGLIAAAPARLPGRNEPCWCGSGRKFKLCHLGRSMLPPLAVRVSWLCRKATSYLERAGDDDDLLLHARARAVDPEDPTSLAEAFEDPIMTDAVLVEGGLFREFLEVRGPLLPEDEALLAEAWNLVARTVYEITEVRPGSGVTVRDLATGDRIEVRERAFSTQAEVGWLACGRVVPDGSGHQFVGGLFPVLPGTESEVLELCGAEDGLGLCAYAGRRFRPPVLRTREGEAVVSCTATFDVTDVKALRLVLDEHYEGEDDTWREMFDLDDGQQIIRATISIVEGRLVVATHSEERLERVLGVLRESAPGVALVRDERVPLKPGEMPSPPPSVGVPVAPGDESVREVLRQVQDEAERRWVREPVPALGGLTPLEAAADPTRVEEVERLIASFPDPGELGAYEITFRPGQLRKLLGLDPSDFDAAH